MISKIKIHKIIFKSKIFSKVTNKLWVLLLIEGVTDIQEVILKDMEVMVDRVDINTMVAITMVAIVVMVATVAMGAMVTTDMLVGEDMVDMDMEDNLIKVIDTLVTVKIHMKLNSIKILKKMTK